MKIDETTYKDRNERLIGMTANHTSQPDKVLFFADPHFLFFNFMAAAQNTLSFFSSLKIHDCMLFRISNNNFLKAIIFFLEGHNFFVRVTLQVGGICLFLQDIQKDSEATEGLVQ